MHAGVLSDLGWSSAGEKDSVIYFRQLGFFTIAKCQRPTHIDLNWLKSFRRSHRTLTTYIEPGFMQDDIHIPGIYTEPFAHSCTSLIDLVQPESALLSSFSQKTRYNITRNLKHNALNLLTYSLDKIPSQHQDAFHTLHTTWSKQKNVIGYSKELLNATIKNYAQSGTLHLAYHNQSLVGSLLILYFDGVATYWAAFATPLGYSLFAPTLLTWHALQKAKANGCDIFDFGGIYDPRYPKMYKKWQGFTKFKEGFRPEVISYPKTTLQLGW